MGLCLYLSQFVTIFHCKLVSRACQIGVHIIVKTFLSEKPHFSKKRHLNIVSLQFFHVWMDNGHLKKSWDKEKNIKHCYGHEQTHLIFINIKQRDLKLI